MLKVFGRKRTRWVIARDPRKSIRCGIGRYVGSWRYHARIMPRVTRARIVYAARALRRVQTMGERV